MGAVWRVQRLVGEVEVWDTLDCDHVLTVAIYKVMVITAIGSYL